MRFDISLVFVRVPRVNELQIYGNNGGFTWHLLVTVETDQAKDELSSYLLPTEARCFQWARRLPRVNPQVDVCIVQETTGFSIIQHDGRAKAIHHVVLHDDIDPFRENLHAIEDYLDRPNHSLADPHDDIVDFKISAKEALRIYMFSRYTKRSLAEIIIIYCATGITLVRGIERIVVGTMSNTTYRSVYFCRCLQSVLQVTSTLAHQGSFRFSNSDNSPLLYTIIEGAITLEYRIEIHRCLVPEDDLESGKAMFL